MSRTCGRSSTTATRSGTPSSAARTTGGATAPRSASGWCSPPSWPGAAGRLDDATADRHREPCSPRSGCRSATRRTRCPSWWSRCAGTRRPGPGTLRFVVLDGLAKPGRLEGPEPELLERAYAAVSTALTTGCWCSTGRTWAGSAPASRPSTAAPPTPTSSRCASGPARSSACRSRCARPTTRASCSAGCTRPPTPARRWCSTRRRGRTPRSPCATRARSSPPRWSRCTSRTCTGARSSATTPTSPRWPPA